MRVLFTATVTTREATPQTFEAGQVYDLVPASAMRWKLRRVAVDAPESVPEAVEIVSAAAASDPPGDAAYVPSDLTPAEDAAGGDAAEAPPDGAPAAVRPRRR